ncbi:MAG: hypothetical protein ACXAEF_10085 [Candidatus Thorarchaeota archaeon]
MLGNWYHIAKAEFQVQTSSFRSNRKTIVIGSFVLGILWATFFAPILVGYVISELVGIPNSVLVMVMPSIMRAGIMFVWILLLILPLSNALQEIKVGQWEIMLSNNVRTREILAGSFAGKLGIYGLYILYLAPILVAPFANALAVSFIGQALMYIAIFVITVGTIWLSNLLVTVIQSKLGASSRGKDLANALAIVLSLVAIIPFVGLQLFAPVMSEILGMNVFLVFPFTWGADLVSQLALIFNGVDLATSTSILGLSWIYNVLLLGIFSVSLFAIGILSADRFFFIGENARSESVTTILRENLIIRGMRRGSRGSFGLLVVTGIKDFTRKAENLSRLALLMVIALVVPVFLYIRAGELELFSVMIMMSLMLGFLGVQVFGGTGFLESEKQLWTIQATPYGIKRFMRAKMIQSMVLILPITLFPGLLYSVIMGLGLVQILYLVLASFISCVGGALVGIGIAASNPTYEDTKSGAYTLNNIRGMMLVGISFMSYLIIDILLSVIGYGELMNVLLGSETVSLLAQLAPLPIVGMVVFIIGQKRLVNKE